MYSHELQYYFVPVPYAPLQMSKTLITQSVVVSSWALDETLQSHTIPFK